MNIVKRKQIYKKLNPNFWICVQLINAHASIYTNPHDWIDLQHVHEVFPEMIHIVTHDYGFITNVHYKPELYHANRTQWRREVIAILQTTPVTIWDKIKNIIFE